MHALTFHGNEKISFETVPDPQLLAPTEVILKTRVAGICGSDLHVYHEREKGLDHGTVMGHEVAGEIVEAGREVRQFKKGDLVVAPFTTNCGGCFYCQIGLTCRCEAGRLFGWVQGGAGLQGVQAEYVRVPLADSTLLALPQGALLEEALFVGDILATGYFCAAQAQIDPAGTYAVIGCGPVGLMALAGAREHGAEKIFAIDMLPERLQLAGDFGATPLHSQNGDPVQVLRAATQGRGADAVLEVVGNPAAQRLAYEMVRPGGIISVVGVHTSPQFAFSPAEAYDKNITYRVGRCPARHLMPRLLPILQSRKYDLQRIISHRLPLHEGVAGYRIFDQKLQGCTKVILLPELKS
jgi:threonine dehydrogenase-like Zn-dependent dehydrogenase